MTLRKFLFWLHLIAGLGAGLVIAIMSFTGAALAFEKEIIAFAENDVSRMAPPTLDASRPSLDEILQRVRTAQPDARPTSITVTSDPTSAIALALGRDSTIYADPSTGNVRTSPAPRTRSFLRLMNVWHRSLALSGDQRPLGRALTGACNAAFLFLALSGLWLWWPRKWRTKGLKRSLIFLRGTTGKARDWNWHNVIGFWSLPILVALTTSGMVISYRWANNLVYQLAGETPPVQGQGAAGGRGANAAEKIPPPSPDARPLGSDALIASAQKNFPAWETITLNLASRSASEIEISRAPVTLSLRLPGTWPRTATTTLTLDPFTGAPLKTETFADLTPGRRARTWLRFLHTGEALGWPGQLVAALASLGACVLVYTGFALAWHRFFIRPKEQKQSA